MHTRTILQLSAFLLARMLAPWSLTAQDNAPLSTIQGRLHSDQTHMPREKIFVHTDKSFYLAGEIIWYKLYYMEAASHLPMDLSRVAYVEILNKDNKSVVQGKVALDSGNGKGSFFLPASLNSGTYRLRAYTNWMKNTGPDCFFQQDLTIVNTAKPLPVPAPAITSHSHRIGFFPEGGNLVYDLPSIIAFELTDKYGRPAQGRGFVLDGSRDTLTTFGPLPSGLGKFELTPLPGHSYKVYVLTPDGDTLANDLPTPLVTGYTMRLTEADNGTIRIDVRAAGTAAGNIYCMARSGNTALVAMQAALTNGTAQFIIRKDSLRTGVDQLTLFNAAGVPVAERLYAIPPHDQPTLDASTDQQLYGIRKKLRLSVTAQAANGLPTPANLSIAVYRQDRLQEKPSTDIGSWLWFGSELSGNIRNPQNEDLDLLMLTHGWRRYHNMPVSEGQTPSFPPEHKGQLITGRLTDPRTGAPVANVQTLVSVPGTQFQFAAARTNSAGRFITDIKDFYGPAGILVQTRTSRDNVYKVEIFNPFSEVYDQSPMRAFDLDKDQRQALTTYNIGVQVANIYNGDSIKRFASPFIDSLPFYGRPDYSYQLDNYTRFTTMEEVLREYVREINVNRMQGHLHVLMLNEPVRQFFDDDNTLVMLDGVPVPDDKIFAYDPLKVKKLDVIPRRYIMGPSQFSGIASFTTYKGDYEGLEMDPRSLLIDYDGLQLEREFYSPAYATEQQAASRLPDFRNLLYWSPDLRTNAKGPQECSFYTSDLPGKYLVVIQGLTNDGQPLVKYLNFEVK